MVALVTQVIVKSRYVRRPARYQTRNSQANSNDSTRSGDDQYTGICLLFHRNCCVCPSKH